MKRNTVARKAAKAAGLKRYNTGTPCKNGHLSDRLVSNGSCLECCAEKKAERDRAYYIRNAEKMRARAKKWREDNPDRAKENDRRKWFAKYEDNLRRCRERYERFRAEDMERKRLAYWENPEAQREKNRSRYRADPTPWRIGSTNRKAKIRNAPGCFSTADIEKIKLAQKNKCACCKTSISAGFHIDHIQPISKGGSNWPKNLQLLCAPCNLRKGAKDPIEFSRTLGRLL